MSEEPEMPPPRLRGHRGSIFVSSLLGETAGTLTEREAIGEEDEEEQSDSEPEVGEEKDEKEEESICKSPSDSDPALDAGTQSAKKAPRRSSMKGLEDQLTQEKLQQLEEIFESADEDGGGGLDMDEFRIAMRTQLGQNITDAELDKIFMKVDTNCDGTVDWDEYLTYMLLECRGQDTMSVQARQPFPRYVETIKTLHRDSIIRLLYITTGRREAEGWSSGCKYASISQEGVVCFWSLGYKLLSSHRTEAPGKSVWVTDACHIPSLQAMLITTTSRDLLIFDISSQRFNRTLTIANMNFCALTIEYWGAGNETMTLADGRKVRALVVLGDAQGGLAVIYFHTDPYLSPLNVKMDANKNKVRIAFQELLLNKLPGMSAIYRGALHNDFIRQVKYCHQLGCTISCSRDSDTAMYVSSLGQKTTDAYFKVTKGIDTFDYCPTLNVIVTGGYDGFVRVWNPYVAKKPVIRLDGHQFPVLHVVINQSREHVVSINEVKEIRIHDLTTQTCIQTIYKKVIIGMGPRHVTAVYLNQRRQGFIFATNSLGILEHSANTTRDSSLHSHAKPVTVALYNPLFEQVVSAGTDSLVCVWNVMTGEKVMQFKAHQVRVQGQSRDIEATAMTFDPTYRRLITAAKNGVVRVWNFNNGACLRELPSAHHHEVTAIVCTGHSILTAGWNRKITVYVDDVDDDTMRWLKDYHRDDILSMDHHNNSILASACHDGNILVWSLATGRLLFCLNAYKSHKQIRAANYFKSGFAKEKADDDGDGDGQEQESAPLEEGDQQRQGDRAAAVKEVGTEQGKEKDRLQCEAEEKKLDKGDYNGKIEEEQENEESGDSEGDQGIGMGDRSQTRQSEAVGTPSIEKLLFLQTREGDEETATLLAACSDGNIQAWSLHHRSGMLGVFPAANEIDGCVLTMETDPENIVLVTGDSHGYVKVFDISNYCLKGWEEREEEEDFRTTRQDWHNEFPFVDWAKMYLKYGGPTSWIKRYFEDTTRPPALNSFRAHLESVSSISLVPLNGQHFLLTASSDCSIRLWTIRGQFIGIFGQKGIWHREIIIPNTNQQLNQYRNSTTTGGVYRNRKVLLPADIRRVGSPTTLTVFNGGRRPAWRLCKIMIRRLFRSNCREKMNAMDQEPIELEHKPSVLHPIDDRLQEVSSSILRGGYRRLTRHHPLPKIPTPKNNGTNQVLSVYSCLKFHSLDPIADIPPPDVVRNGGTRKGFAQGAYAPRLHKVVNKLRAVDNLRKPKSKGRANSLSRSSFSERSSRIFKDAHDKDGSPESSTLLETDSETNVESSNSSATMSRAEMLLRKGLSAISED